MPNKRLDITGHVYGRLTVIKELEPKGYTRIWLCRCNCGQSADFPVHMRNLRNGHTKSCGCQKKELATKRQSKDLSGKKFGKLAVIKSVGTTNRRLVWECLCDCGNLVNVGSQELIGGGTQSCGCKYAERLKKIKEYNDGTIPHLLQSKLRSDNTTGVTGVYKVVRNGSVKYRAELQIKRERKYLGFYDTFEDAVKARKKAEEEFHKPYIEGANKINSD